MLNLLKKFWYFIRRLSGDDAYEQYVKHYQQFHAQAIDAPPMLSRKAFFELWQDSQWKKPNRCC